MKAKAETPLLNWPGGKRFLASRLTQAIRLISPQHYCEPFAGGAAVFFALKPKSGTLSDINSNLINLYNVVREEPSDLIDILSSDFYRNCKTNYYNIRNYRPTSSLRKAARFYFLQRFSFNGIYRENLNGIFNVPYGYKTTLPQADEAQIMQCSETLQGTLTFCGDFTESMRIRNKNTVVYADPPYTTSHNQNGFIKYNQNIFSLSDQYRLAEKARQLASRDVHVIVSNANHAAIDKLYQFNFRKLVISRFSKIAAASEARKIVTEAIYISKHTPREIDSIICS